MTGGYKIIDLKGANLTVNGDAVTVAGTYAAIEETMKPIMITHFSIGGVEKPSRFAILGLNDTTYEGNIGINAEGNGLFIHITDEDAVSLTDQ